MSTQRHIAAVGVFDGVHAGHRHLLRRLVEAAQRLHLAPMAITFRHHPLHIIAPEAAPLMLSTLPSRIELLHKAGAERVEVLDFDHAMRQLSAGAFMRMLHDRYNVDALLVGFNNHVGHDRVGDIPTLQAIGSGCGVTVIGADPVDGPDVSSSIIRSMIDSGHIAEAAHLLGHPYALTGEIAAGRQLGRTIGFPTANVTPPQELIIPADGVYAAMATTYDSVTSPAMVNIGTCPTVADDHARTIEAHIIGRDCGEIYGTPLSLAFIERLRDEQRFPTLEALQQQLNADRSRAISILSDHNVTSGI